ILTAFPFRYIQYLANQVRPLWSTFAITENCNARCEYCRYWRRRRPDLPSDAVFTVLRGLKRLGVRSVVFSGGECLLRADLLDIIRFAGELGMATSVVTNGSIRDKELFYELMRRGAGGLTFSLDGATPPVHEMFRKGCAFHDVVKSIRMAVAIRDRYRFRTRIATTTVVHRANLSELENIHRLRESLGADQNYFQPVWPIFEEEEFDARFGFSHAPPGTLEKVARDLGKIPGGNLKKYSELIPWFYENFHRVSNRFQCFAGRAFVHVDARGDLLPCSPLVKEPMGSLLTDDVREIVTAPGLKSRLRGYGQFRCGGCTMACYMEKNIVLSGLQNPVGVLKRMAHGA
ncbi:MAG: radical SAM protein, partial [Desulfobacterales bacterium]|nr:radical SAM protein [Desulfobacterales bacterium]